MRFWPRLSWQALQKGRAVAWKLEVRLLRRGLPKGWGVPPLAAVWTENTELAHRSQLRIRNTSLGAFSYHGTSVPDERFWSDGITLSMLIDHACDYVSWEQVS